MSRGKASRRHLWSGLMKHHRSGGSESSGHKPWSAETSQLNPCKPFPRENFKWTGNQAAGYQWHDFRVTAVFPQDHFFSGSFPFNCATALWLNSDWYYIYRKSSSYLNNHISPRPSFRVSIRSQTVWLTTPCTTRCSTPPSACPVQRKTTPPGTTDNLWVFFCEINLKNKWIPDAHLGMNETKCDNVLECTCSLSRQVEQHTLTKTMFIEELNSSDSKQSFFW